MADAHNVVRMFEGERDKAVASLRSGGPGDTSGSMSDPAIRRLEDKVDSNQRWLLSVYGAGVLLLLTAFGGGYLALEGRGDAHFDTLSNKLDVISRDISSLGERTAKVEATVAALPKR